MSKVTIVLIVIVVIIALVMVASLIANYQFNQNVKKEVNTLFSKVENKDEVIKKADLEALPLSVQRWLENSQVIGKERIRTVRLKQKAVMRTEKEAKWMPTEAEQYFTVEEPAFIWKAKIKAAPMLHIVGRDKYYQGKGNMFIKFLSLIKVADARGKEIDQGTLLRYLAETVWFPTAALSSYITWEAVDENSAKATMSYGGVNASGVFYFNQQGEVTNFVGERYMEKKGQYSLETWSVLAKDHKEFNGIRVPSKAEVIWKLKDGDFSWYRLEVTEIEYNKPTVY